MQITMPSATAGAFPADGSIGRIVSVTGSKAIVLLDGGSEHGIRLPAQRPEMGTLLAIEQMNTVVLAIVSALSVPVPARGESRLRAVRLSAHGSRSSAGSSTPPRMRKTSVGAA